MSQPVPILERLRAAADRWVEAHGATPARLGKLVVRDTTFFARLAQPGTSTTTATLEKFAAFLIDPANWPDATVAEEAEALAHVTGVSARPRAAATVDAAQKDSEAA